MPLPKPSIICTRKLINHQPKISPIVAMKVVHGRNIFCIFFFFYSVLVYKERLNMFIKPGFIPTSYAICRMVILKHIDVQDNIDNTFQNYIQICIGLIYIQKSYLPTLIPSTNLPLIMTDSDSE